MPSSLRPGWTGSQGLLTPRALHLCLPAPAPTRRPRTPRAPPRSGGSRGSARRRRLCTSIHVSTPRPPICFARACLSAARHKRGWSCRHSQGASPGRLVVEPCPPISSCPAAACPPHPSLLLPCSPTPRCLAATSPHKNMLVPRQGGTDCNASVKRARREGPFRLRP